jgi:hypothetical protein
VARVGKRKIGGQLVMMEHLKAVGKAIKNSPKAIRKKFVHVDHHER